MFRNRTKPPFYAGAFPLLLHPVRRSNHVLARSLVLMQIVIVSDVDLVDKLREL
jgi:hypothetical protein